MTQRDLFKDIVKPDSIALGCFPVDSHVVSRLATPDGKEVVNEGGFLVIPPIYEIQYRALVPKAAECDNLLVTSALSSSRVACNSLRVEPTWMMLGEAAGIAAAMAQKDKKTVQRVNVSGLQKRLQEAGVPFKNHEGSLALFSALLESLTQFAAPVGSGPRGELGVEGVKRKSRAGGGVDKVNSEQSIAP